jgi:hypothetical protein
MISCNVGQDQLPDLGNVLIHVEPAGGGIKN